MEADEAGTHPAMKDMREEIIEPLVGQHARRNHDPHITRPGALMAQLSDIMAGK